MKVTYINPMVPDGYDCESVPGGTGPEIGDVEEEVAIVPCTEAVVDPRTVMVHGKDALVTHLTVRSASWLDLIAGLALPLPHLSKVVDRLVPVLHEGFHLA